MVRTLVQLKKEQIDALKELARARGVSVSELVRQGVDLMIARSAGATPRDLRARAMLVSGRFRSRVRDLSTGHDRYLAEDLAQ